MTNKPNIPREEIDNAIVFNRPFTLNNAVMNDPSNRNNNNNKSKDSGKESNASGIIKVKIRKVNINTNEIKLKYFFISPLHFTLFQLLFIFVFFKHFL